MRYLFLLVPFFCCDIAISQVTFQKAYGTLHDEALPCTPGESVVNVTTDNGYVGLYISSNYSTTPTTDGLFFFRVDEYGDTIFNKLYHIIGDHYQVKSVQQLHEGGFLIGANFTGMPSHASVSIKTDDMGNITWCKGFSGSAFYSLWLSDNTILNLGTSGYGMYHNRVDMSGNLISSHYYDGGGMDAFMMYSAIETANHDIISVGYAWPGMSDMFMMRTDPANNVVVAKSYSFWPEESAIGDVLELPDKSIVLAGAVNNSCGIVIKMDSVGNVIFLKKYYTTGYIGFGSCALDANGNIMLLGNTDYGNTAWDIRGMSVKIDQSGTVLDARIYDNLDNATCIQSANDGGFIIGGISSLPGYPDNDAFLIKTDENGEAGCQTHSFPVSVADVAPIVTDYSFPVSSVSGAMDYLLDASGPFKTIVKCENPDDAALETNVNGAELSVYPNPATDCVSISANEPGDMKILITDAFGKIVYEGRAIGMHNTNIDVIDFAPGIYTLSILSEQGRSSAIFIKK